MDYWEKRKEQKAELAKLTEDQLRYRWSQNDHSLWEMEQEADRRGYHTPGDDYFSSDLEDECELINEILKERGLPIEERPVWDEEGEEPIEPAGLAASVSRIEAYNRDLITTAEAIQARLIVAIEQYLKDHPETTREQISLALSTVKAAYDSGEYPIGNT